MQDVVEDEPYGRDGLGDQVADSAQHAARFLPDRPQRLLQTGRWFADAVQRRHQYVQRSAIAQRGPLTNPIHVPLLFHDVQVLLTRVSIRCDREKPSVNHVYNGAPPHGYYRTVG